MCEPEEDIPTRSKELSMGFYDYGLDNPWPIGQITMPSSPSEHPCSPLWAFSDVVAPAADDDDKLRSTAGSRPLSLSDYPYFITYKPSSVEKDESRKLPSPYIGLIEKHDTYYVMKERMTQALRYFKESTEQQVLAQVWVPIKNGSDCVLTTSNQPFYLDPHCSGLNQYRMVSVMYMFSADGESDRELGLPGRVFRRKLPEWTPNVQYYTSGEFSRLDHAHHYNVQGTLALPIFEPSASGHSCVGVLELILTSEIINYAPEVDKIAKALQAVDLKSSEISVDQNTQICNESRKNALSEILEILTVVCETHKLPMAQTWIPCRHRSVLANGGGLKKKCMSFDESCMGQICMSTTDVAYYVVDAHMWGFRDACAEHHLQKGEGVAGRAFLSRNSCFCRDITQFCKTEYPLVHYARMFKLSSCYAICLQSSYTGDDDYILEFFLPPEITNPDEQDSLLNSLSATMKQHFQSLGVSSQQEGAVELVLSDLKPNVVPNGGESAFTSNVVNIANKNATNLSEIHAPTSLPQVEDAKKTTRKKRGKTEKVISLEVLKQYFTGSLKDAAKSLGVCPTTMKRICRQHGISRWPSRKINKVSRSVVKLQRVINSVQGPEGKYLTSLTSGPLPVAAAGWPSSTAETKDEKTQLPNYRSPETDAHAGLDSKVISIPEDIVPDQSAGTPKCHGSCNGSPATEPAKDFNRLSALSVEEFIFKTELSGPFAEDAGSSKDLKNISRSIGVERLLEPSWIKQTFCVEEKNVTVKATYRNDMIRFRVPPSYGILDLKEQVEKRIKIEMGSFEIKYKDDDSEWVSMSCDADLQECLDMARSSDKNIVRLLVSDAMPYLGSSCESIREFS